MTSLATMTALAVLLCFTRAEVARADEARSLPAAPGLRTGTVVGFTDLFGQRFTTLGAQVALCYRIGPALLEVDYDTTELLEYTGLGNVRRGRLARTGVAARYFVARIGPGAEKRSLLRVFVEGSLGVQRGVLDDLRVTRADLGVGGGVRLEHRFRSRPRVVPATSIGWHLGWRMTASPRGPKAMPSCKGACRPPREPAPLLLAVSSSLILEF